MVKLCIDCNKELDSNRKKRCDFCKSIQNMVYKNKCKKLLERLDYRVGDVEKDHHRGKAYWKEDLWNMFDLISISVMGRINFINVFDAKKYGSEYSLHKKKFAENIGILLRIFEGGNIVSLMGLKYSKKKKCYYFLVHEYNQFHNNEYTVFKYRIYFNLGYSIEPI